MQPRWWYYCASTLLIGTLPVRAHLPERVQEPSVPYLVDTHWYKQSIALYVDPTTHFTVRVPVVQGDLLHVSLSMSSRDPVPDGVHMAVHGPDAASMTCTPEWAGWTSGALTTPPGWYDDEEDGARHQRQQEGGVTSASSTLVVPDIQALGGPPRYEPFGVGMYTPVRACEARFPATGMYNLTVTAPTAFKFNVGFGQAENWVEFANPRLGLHLLDIFQWFALGTSRTLTDVWAPGLGAMGLWGFGLWCYWRRTRTNTLTWRGEQGIRGGGAGLFWLAITWLMVGPGVFAGQIVWTVAGVHHYTGSVGLSVWIHVLLPLACLVWLAVGPPSARRPDREASARERCAGWVIVAVDVLVVGYLLLFLWLAMFVHYALAAGVFGYYALRCYRRHGQWQYTSLATQRAR